VSDNDIGERNDNRDGVLIELRPSQRCVGASQLTEVKEERRDS